MESSQVQEQGSENIMIEQYCGKFYSWKIESEVMYKDSQETRLPKVIEDDLSEKITILVNGFFAKQRGDPESVVSLCNDFLAFLKKQFKNIQMENTLISFFITEFNDFHSKVQELQSETTRKAIEGAKNRIHFIEKYERTFRKDLILSECEYILIQRMFETKGFDADILLEEFLSLLKNFMPSYDSINENKLHNICQNMIQQFYSEYDSLKRHIKNKITNYVKMQINCITFMRIKLFISDVEENLVREDAKYDLIFEQYLIKEEISIKQLLVLDYTHILIILHLKTSKKLMVISNKEYISKPLEDLIDDEDTVFLQGSSKEVIIFIMNTQRRVIKACLAEEKLLSKGEIDFFSTNSLKVLQACYLRCFDMILYLSSAKLLNIFYLKNQTSQRMNEISFERTYENMRLSTCERFIIFKTSDQILAYSFHFNLIFEEFLNPFFAEIHQDSVFTVFIEDSNFVVRKLECSVANTIAPPVVSTRRDKAENLKLETWALMKKMAIDMVKTNNFS